VARKRLVPHGPVSSEDIRGDTSPKIVLLLIGKLFRSFSELARDLKPCGHLIHEAADIHAADVRDMYSRTSDKRRNEKKKEASAKKPSRPCFPRKGKTHRVTPDAEVSRLR